MGLGFWDGRGNLQLLHPFPSDSTFHSCDPPLSLTILSSACEFKASSQDGKYLSQTSSIPWREKKKKTTTEGS